MRFKGSFKIAYVVMLVILCCAATHAQVTAIKAGKLIDPATGTVSVNQVILIEARPLKPLALA